MPKRIIEKQHFHPLGDIIDEERFGQLPHDQSRGLARASLQKLVKTNF